VSLVRTLLSLAIIGTPRIQRQVIPICRRVLPHVKPEALDALFSKEMGVVRSGGAVAYVLLAMAKAMRVVFRGASNKGAVEEVTIDQVSEQTAGGVWIRGDVSVETASELLLLVQSLRQVPQWKNPIDALVQSAIVDLKTLQKRVESQTQVPQLPQLWVALASLCLVGSDGELAKLVEEANRASDGTTITCDNHDDGQTEAAFRCGAEQCNINLCADCDRILHLSRDKRLHARTPIISDGIKVDVHESNARVKLSTLMVTVDRTTFKAMVQFRVDSGSAACRFCSCPVSDCPASAIPASPALTLVCGKDECQEKAAHSCLRMHTCGHVCTGVRNEQECLPCLHGCGGADTKLTQDQDDTCIICWCETLIEAPSVMLECGHVVHYHCARKMLELRWNGPRITFGFAGCPTCRRRMAHPLLEDLTKPINELCEKVRAKALIRIDFMGLENAEELQPGGRFHGDKAGYAMDRLAYYLCYKCKEPYFGGERACAAEAPEAFDPEELVCGGCSGIEVAQVCSKHGREYLGTYQRGEREIVRERERERLT